MKPHHLSSSPYTPSSPVGGMVLAVLAFSTLSAVDVLCKLLAAGYPVYQIMAINGLFALGPILLWTWLSGGLVQLRTPRLGKHVMRGSVAVISAFCAMAAYSQMPLTDFYAIMFTAPMVATIMSVVFLREQVALFKWMAIAIGFIGVLVVMMPTAGGVGGGADEHQVMFGRILAAGSVMANGLSVTLIRRMRQGETSMSFAFYGYGMAVVLCGALTVVFGGNSLNGVAIGHMALSGTFAGLSGIFMMSAYHRAPVALVAPIQYSQIIWGGIAGYVIWHHMPSVNLVAGSLVVMISGLGLMLYEIKGKQGAAKAVTPKLPIHGQKEPVV